MKELARNADLVRTLQAKMTRAGHCDDYEMYSPHKISLRLKRNERPSLDVELLSLDSDTHM